MVRHRDRIIADTKRPMVLYESGFAPRWYVPRADINESALTPVERQTFCPYKGLCSYYNIGEAEVRKRGHEALYQELLAGELDHIERSFSVPKKADRLHYFCRPEKEWGLWPYDRDELRRIDELRHDIIHGDKLGQPIPSIEKDLDFMQNSATYFLAAVQRRYGLKIISFEVRMEPSPGLIAPWFSLANFLPQTGGRKALHRLRKGAHLPSSELVAGRLGDSVNPDALRIRPPGVAPHPEGGNPHLRNPD
jgi:hypothetical protein